MNSVADAGVAATAAARLNRRYFLDFPLEAAVQIEGADIDDVLEPLTQQPAQVLLPVWRRLNPAVAAAITLELPREQSGGLIEELSPGEAVRLLGQLDEADVAALLETVRPEIARDIRTQLEYPADTAGRLMDPKCVSMRGSITAGKALEALRRNRSSTSRSLFLVDDENRLSAKVAIQDLAVAEPDTPLEALSVPIVATVGPLASSHEVGEIFERYRLADLPVIDLDGHLMGIVYHTYLVQAMQEDATASIQSMVGASKDERALSPALFAVKKRLPWLQINLLTAFLAAAVVGLFEDTIARFTALAVLLPVVAGQSGNAGAQALAVTMRGLALREITVRQWLPVMFKEVKTGFVNGLAVALTCGVAVMLWSKSFGLVVVIAVSMVLAMTAAGFAGALVPIVLTRLGQDPAQASSIILTTVTDIAGFFSFLGIASLLASML